jgi:two-component system, chemotaxis family, protein-glutamate methylesterase/glutaminase
LKKSTVFIVDDSIVVRNLIRESLVSIDSLMLSGAASNGKLALPRIEAYKPNFIILDYEMPEMNGLETLEEIKKISPSSKVIMFSSYTTKGAKVTLEALKKGAIDFVPKPSSTNSSSPLKYIQENLIKKITNLTEHSKTQENITVNIVKRKLRPLGSYRFCFIGVSTGGPQVLRDFLPEFSAKFSGSIFITQHMPAMFTEQLAKSLNADSELTVKEAVHLEEVQPGMVYIAPGGGHLQVKQHGLTFKTHVLADPPFLNCQPSVNIMFQSIHVINPAECVAVLLTGMGDDGYVEWPRLYENGSYLIAQNQVSSLVYGMPKKPHENNLLDFSGDIKGIAAKVTSLIGNGR